MYIGGTLRTPFIVATTMGKNEARKIRKIGARLLTPNQITASGIHASGEIGRSSWISGFTARASGVHHTRMRPSGTPSVTARAYPQPTRNNESPMYDQRIP